MAVVGEAQIRITPDTSNFGTALISQINAVMPRVQTQFNSRFAQAGRAAADGMAQGFSRQSAPAMRQAVQRTAATVRPAMQQAGVESGRLFGQGVGEGFAALAAFAIAAQVKRFFTDTIQSAIEFESAFAGVRRTVDTNVEGFAQLRQEITDMAARLPFTASEIAKVASEAGRLGVQAPNIEGFTETILKLSTVTGAAQDELAGNLARFTTVTQRSLGEVGLLGDVLLKLDTASAASATEILHFTQRLAPLAARTNITAEEVLALSTGLRQAGVQADAGGTAVTRVIDEMNKAATQGGTQLTKFANLLGVTNDQFRDLVVSNPTEALLQFLDAIGQTGLASTATLQDLGLGADRITRSIGGLSASVDTLRGFITSTGGAIGEINSQFKEFAETPEQRLKVLQNQFEETQRSIGGQFLPAIIAAGQAVAGLSVPTVSLGLATAGIAALGFTFIRLRNILREVSGTLGGANLTTAQFNTVMGFARQQGQGFAVTLNQLKTGQLEYVAATEAGTQATIRATGAQAAHGRSMTSFGAAFRAARAEQKAFAAEQIAQAAAVNKARAAAQQAFPGVDLGVATANTGARGLRGIAEAANTARAAVGGLSGAVNLLGRAFGAFFIVDILTQATEGLANMFDTIARGEQNLDAVNNSIIRMAASMGNATNQATALNDTLNSARVEQIGGWDQLGQSLSDAFRDIGGQFVSGPIKEFANDIPLIGRLIETSSEQGSRKLGDLVEGFTKFADIAGPKAAEALLNFTIASDQFQSRITSQNLTTEQAEAAFADLRQGWEDAAKTQSFLAENSDALISQLRALGAAPEEIAAALQSLGLGAQAAAAGLQTASEASANFASIASTIANANAQYAQRVRAIAPSFNTFRVEGSRGAAAAARNADTIRNAARRIADAERALADARRDSRRQIEDAQRRIADAEVEAARRIADAQRRLGEVRRDALRSSRDAQQALQDFNRALELRGGPASEEDLIRQRELEQAVADTFVDNARAVADAQRVLVEVRVEGDERIADAQRKLAEVQETSGQRIADALRRLAQAQEDAARKGERAAAAGKTAGDSIIRTAGQLRSALTNSLGSLRSFNRNLEGLSERVLGLFKTKKGKGFAAEFLRELQSMGPAAVPLLRSLNNLSDSELKKIVGIFRDRIKESKRAADLEWDKFQPNFGGKISALAREVNSKARDMMQTFDTAVAGGMHDVAEHLRPELQKMAANISTMVGTSRARLALFSETIKELEKRGIDVELSVDTRAALAALAEWGRKLNAAGLEFRVNANGDLVVVSGNPKLINFAAHGATIMGSKVQAAAQGFTPRPGQPILLGERGPELFFPNSAGAIFRHTDTAKILRALGTSRGGTVQHIQVNEVAHDPRATARSIAWILGSEAVR